MTDKRSRRRGRGALYRYKTKAGERWRWQLYVPVDPEDPDGETRRTGGGGFKTAGDADDALRDAVKRLRSQETFATAGAPTVAAYAAQWVAGLRLEASTIQGYERIIRNHVAPQLGTVKIDKLTATRIARHYRELERSGRRDGVNAGKPLSANSVNKIHVVLGAMLDAAIDDNLISQNPARKRRTVNAPTGKAIRAAKPEIVTWSAEELHDFLDWNSNVFDDDLHALWRTIAWTGMRRSEALALRWGDVDLQRGRVSIRRAADVTARNVAKTTKTGSARVVDLDAGTVDALRSYRAQRGSLALTLARADAYAFGNDSGEIRSPNEISRRWSYRVAKAQASLDELPRVTLKGLRHTHATLLLEMGEHPKIVQERLGHSTISTTMNIYSHVTPTMQRSAIDRLAARVDGA
jgi:integrase